MDRIDLKDALKKINVNADWIGLREVKETKTFRFKLMVARLPFTVILA